MPPPPPPLKYSWIRHCLLYTYKKKSETLGIIYAGFIIPQNTTSVNLPQCTYVVLLYYSLGCFWWDILISNDPYNHVMYWLSSLLTGFIQFNKSSFMSFINRWKQLLKSYNGTLTRVNIYSINNFTFQKRKLMVNIVELHNCDVTK